MDEKVYHILHENVITLVISKFNLKMLFMDFRAQ